MHLLKPKDTSFFHQNKKMDKRRQASLTKFDKINFIPPEREEHPLADFQPGYNAMSLNQIISPDPNTPLKLQTETPNFKLYSSLRGCPQIKSPTLMQTEAASRNICMAANILSQSNTASM